MPHVVIYSAPLCTLFDCHNALWFMRKESPIHWLQDWDLMFAHDRIHWDNNPLQTGMNCLINLQTVYVWMICSYYNFNKHLISSADVHTYPRNTIERLYYIVCHVWCNVCAANLLNINSHRYPRIIWWVCTAGGSRTHLWEYASGANDTKGHFWCVWWVTLKEKKYLPKSK